MPRIDPDAVLIQQPSVNFGLFLGLASKALGHSPAAAADKTTRELSESEKFLSCLAAFREDDAPVGFNLSLLAHVSFSMFVGAHRDDLTDIVEFGNMPFVAAETELDEFRVAVMTGTLAQWRDAVRCGLTVAAPEHVRRCYTKIMSQFERAGLAPVWRDLERKSDRVGFLLEDKRK